MSEREMMVDEYSVFSWDDYQRSADWLTAHAHEHGEIDYTPKFQIVLREYMNRLTLAERERDALRRALLHCYDCWQDGTPHIPIKCDACQEVDQLIEKAWGKDRVRG